MTTVTLLTYPARPVNGGPLPSSGPKFGEYLYSPKYNGWRAMVHVPTGTMFNRKGDELSIAREFGPALESLRSSPFEWLDCEALERRHNIGRGTLIVLDAPIRLLKAEDRFELLSKEFPIHNSSAKPATDSVYLAIQIPAKTERALSIWEDLQGFNREFGCDFYEGVVAKEVSSIYPIQLRNPEVTIYTWIKHRWHW